MKIFFSTLIFFIISKVSAQLYVKSSIDSLPVPNAKITINNSSTYFFTNSFGAIQLPYAKDSLSIHISHFAFQNTSIKTMNNNIIYIIPNFGLIENATVYTGNLNEKKYVKDDIANVKIISAKEIQNTASQNLGDILKYQPNITLTQDAVLGTSIAINGMSGQNVKILKNGAAVAGTMNGSVDVSQVNLGNVEQIEIIEGPMSLLYGSNALAGTINILSQLPVKKTSANAKAYTESTGIYNVSGSVSKKIKNNTGLSFYLGRNFFDGWHTDNNFFYNYNAKNSNRYSLWKPRVQLLSDISLLHKINKNISLKFNSDYLSETIINKGLPTMPYYESAFDDYYYTLRNINSLELNIKQGKLKHNILASYTYFKRIKNSFLNDLTEKGKGILTHPESQDTTTIHTSQLRYVNQYKLKNFSFNTGIDINHEIFNGKRVLNNSQSIYNGSLIAVVGYTKKNKIDILLGARQMVHSISRIPLIPSFIIKYHLPKNIQLKYNAAKGYRTPGVKEMYLYFVDINHNIIGNENLQSESSINQNIGVSQRIKIDKNAILNWQANTYINQFKQLITLATINNNGTEYTYINIGKYETRGINADINFKNNRLETGVQGALIATSNTEQVEGTPAFFNTINLALKGSYKFLKTKNLTLNTYINNFGKSPYLAIVNNVAQILQTQSYTMVDANVNYVIKHKKMEISLALGLKNLNNISNIKTGISTGGGHQNSNGQRLISTGRTLFCGIEIKL